GIERHHLAVEHGAASRELAGESRKLGVAPRGVDEVAGHELDVAVLHPGENADPVPLDLERPALAIAWRLRRERREHGSERPGNAEPEAALACVSRYSLRL